MKRAVIPRFLTIGLLGLLCLPDPAAAQATHTIDVSVLPNTGGGPRGFVPSDLTIQVGDTVRWVKSYNPYTYSGRSVDNVIADDSSFASPTHYNFIYSHTFTQAGEILYHCSRHSSPGQDRSKFENGRIIVQGGDGGSASNLALQRVHAASGTYKPGDAIPIDLTIENAGGQASPAFSVTYYASRNPRIDASDTELGTDNRPSLGAGQSSSFTGNAAFPADIPSGLYFIGAIINVSDANSDNNIGISNGAVPVVFQINQGLNDAWFNPDTPGQGFFITVFPDIQKIFLAWFAFDVERPSANVTARLGDPGHRWLTALGDYAEDTATLDIEITAGGVFDSATPATTPRADGTITLGFSGCNAGTVTYDIPSIGRQGTIPIERIALSNVPLCESFATQ